MTDYSKYIWHNSKIIPWEKAKIHVMSHVLHYGSGVFEGIRCYDTAMGPQIFRLDDHINRLFTSAKAYKMNVRASKESIIDGCKEIVKTNNLQECYIRPIIFYGYDTLGVNPKECPINISIASFFWGAYLGEEGIINGVNVTERLRTPEISSFVSKISSNQLVREQMVLIQRKISQDKSIVIDGRDIGTVVFPDADYKFFITASIKERTKRRFKELQLDGINTDLYLIEKQIKDRDHLDSTRSNSPLKKAKDAILIDTTHLNIDEQVNLILGKINKHN